MTGGLFFDADWATALRTAFWFFVCPVLPESPPRHSLICMKIRVNLATLSNEQVKFLTGLGMFLDDETWEGGCDPDEFEEAIEWLRRAGIPEKDMRVEFNSYNPCQPGCPDQ